MWAASTVSAWHGPITAHTNSVHLQKTSAKLAFPLTNSDERFTEVVRNGVGGSPSLGES